MYIQKYCTQLRAIKKWEAELVLKICIPNLYFQPMVFYQTIDRIIHSDMGRLEKYINSIPPTLQTESLFQRGYVIPTIDFQRGILLANKCVCVLCSKKNVIVNYGHISPIIIVPIIY